MIAIVLTAGGVIGLAYGIRNARAVIKLGDITVDSSTVTYIASFYKMKYIEKHDHEGAGDTEEFWSTLTADGVTHARDYQAEFKEYLRLTVAEAYLYITCHGYTAEDKLQVAQKSDSVLREYADGSIAEFNEVAESYGFDYNDFQNADALIYKADRARELLPESLGAEEYENRLAAACESVIFNQSYDYIDLISVPIINDYYVREE